MTTLQDLITPELLTRFWLTFYGITDRRGNVLPRNPHRESYEFKSIPEWKYLGNPARDKAVNVYMQTSDEAEKEIRRLRALSDLLLDKIEEEK